MHASIKLLRRLTCIAGWVAWSVVPAIQPNMAFADEYITTVRVTCAPEIPLFSIEYLAINDTANFMWHNWYKTHSDDASWRQIRKYGFLPASRFDYTCKLPKATYRIRGHMPPLMDHGECGGDPRPSLTLTRDSEVVLDKVYLLGSCIFGNDSGHLGKIDIHGATDGDAEVVDAQLYDNEGHSADLWAIKTATQDMLDCLVKRPPFLKGEGYIYDARHDCSFP